MTYTEYEKLVSMSKDPSNLTLIESIVLTKLNESNAIGLSILMHELYAKEGSRTSNGSDITEKIVEIFSNQNISFSRYSSLDIGNFIDVKKLLLVVTDYMVFKSEINIRSIYDLYTEVIQSTKITLLNSINNVS